MSLIILEEINTRASRTFKPEASTHKWKDWFVHWYTTAEAFATECDRDDLPATAATIRALLAEQRIYHDEIYKD